MFWLQRVGSHGSIMSKIKTFKRLRATRGGGFVSCQTSAFQEEMYTNLGNKWDSSQERGCGSS